MPASSRRRLRDTLVLATVLAIAASCGGGSGGGGNGLGTGDSGLVDGASLDPSAVVAAQTSFPGEFAADFLRRTRFTSLVVEIDYAVGFAPAASVVNLIEDRLGARCDKPGGVSVVVDDAIPLAEFGNSPLDISDIEDLENAHRDFFADGNTQTAVLYILLVKGTSNIAGGGSTQVLALTYHGSSIALFVDVVEDSATPFETAAEITGAGLVHEAGHALGLVNGGCPMVNGHEDSRHDGHDESQDSIMYWLIQIDPVAPNIGDADFALFGFECETDMAAVGGLPVTALPAMIATSSPPASRVEIGTCGTCLLRAERARAAAAAAGGACPAKN